MLWPENFGTCFLLGKLLSVQGCPEALVTVFQVTVTALRVFPNIHEVTTVIMPITQIRKLRLREVTTSNPKVT